ncbi:hypothetical protein ABT337_16685 [Saccharopolyspora hirsuta]|uniref:Uncharacterized protein n=1 Tax=Saccharopolyspora hirsuta TaxID=1837 RepID=A0A5M7BZD9_SACHI|nr:hypothetical protein [Saccharopolyspora hirsuta]KAA5833587.1 hypothetical protein F1721_15050 [Saccharopolyspora hirsuta]
MRSVKRAIVATALGLPIMLGAPAMALAHGGYSDDQLQNQDQDASTDQANYNVSPIYQFSVGSNSEQNAVNWVDQTNASSTEQNEGAYQSDED